MICLNGTWAALGPKARVCLLGRSRRLNALVRPRTVYISLSVTCPAHSNVAPSYLDPWLPAHTPNRWVESTRWLVAWPSPTPCRCYTSTGVAPTHLWEVGWGYFLIIGMTDRSVCQHVRDGSHYGTCVCEREVPKIKTQSVHIRKQSPSFGTQEVLIGNW